MARLIQYETKATEYDGEWKWQAAGMCYIIRLESGELIVIDGGHAADAEGLIEQLWSISGGKPKIAAWLLSHPHKDHIGALHKIVCDDELSEKLDIKALYSSAPVEFEFAKGRILDVELRMQKEIEAFFGERHIEPKAEESFDIGEARIDFLFTYVDGEELADSNELSMVFTVTVNGKKIMFTGDQYRRSLDMLAQKHGDVLRSDILQVAHHALNGGSTKFYELCRAKTVLIPISHSGYRAMKLEKYDELNAPARYAISHASIRAYAFDGNFTLEL